MKDLYKSAVVSIGGRAGHVRSEDGRLDLQLTMTERLGGHGGDGTNPEQLFAAGYAACFESALRLVAQMQCRPITDAEVKAVVTLSRSTEHKYTLSMELHGKVDELDEDRTLALMRAAHEVCPYSNATRGNIMVTLVAA